MQTKPDTIGGALPQHVAFIMDGNGRWAQAKGLPRSMGHREGSNTLRNILRCAFDWNIPWVTCYAFSTENWARPQTEIKTLFELIVEMLTANLAEFIDKKVRIHVLGDIAGLPPFIQQALMLAMERTKTFSEKHFQIAVNYGGRDEIIRAIKRYVKEHGPQGIEQLTPVLFANYLDTAGAPDPDLMIRTSGEQRISNFLLWQMAYAECLFIDTPWPDFTEDLFLQAIETYSKRQRRFGMTDEQRSNV